MQGHGGQSSRYMSPQEQAAAAAAQFSSQFQAASAAIRPHNQSFQNSHFQSPANPAYIIPNQPPPPRSQRLSYQPNAQSSPLLAQNLMSRSSSQQSKRSSMQPTSPEMASAPLPKSASQKTFRNIFNKLDNLESSPSYDSTPSPLAYQLQLGPAIVAIPSTWKLHDTSTWDITDSAVFSQSTSQPKLSLSFIMMKPTLSSETLQEWLDSFVDSLCGDLIEINRNHIEFPDTESLLYAGCLRVYLRNHTEYRSFYAVMDRNSTARVLVVMYCGYPIIDYAKCVSKVEDIIKNAVWSVSSIDRSNSGGNLSNKDRNLSGNLAGMFSNMSFANRPQSGSSNFGRSGDEPQGLVIPPRRTQYQQREEEFPQHDSPPDIAQIYSNLINEDHPFNTDVQIANSVLSHPRSHFSMTPVNDCITAGYFKFTFAVPSQYISDDELSSTNIQAVVTSPTATHLFFPPRPMFELDSFTSLMHSSFSMKSQSTDHIQVSIHQFPVNYVQQRCVVQGARKIEYRVYSLIDIPGILSKTPLMQLIVSVTTDLKDSTNLVKLVNDTIKSAVPVPAKLTMPKLSLTEMVASPTVMSEPRRYAESENQENEKREQGQQQDLAALSPRTDSRNADLVGLKFDPIRPRAIADLFGLRRIHGRLEGVYMGHAVSVRKPKKQGTNLAANNYLTSNSASSSTSTLPNFTARRGVVNDPFENEWVRKVIIISNDGYVLDGVIPKSGTLSRFYVDSSDSNSNGAGGAAECNWIPENKDLGKYRMFLNDNEKIVIHWNMIAEDVEEKGEAKRTPGTTVSEAKIVDDDTLVFDGSQFMTVNELRMRRVSGFPLLSENMMEIKNIKEVEPQSLFRVSESTRCLDGRYSSGGEEYLQFWRDGRLLVMDRSVLSKFQESERNMAGSGMWRFRAWHFTLEVINAEGVRIEFSIVPVPVELDSVLEATADDVLKEVYIDGVLYKRIK